MKECGVWWGLWKGWEERWMEISCWKLQSVSTIMNINIAYTPRVYTYTNIQIDISMIFISLRTLQMTAELNPIIPYLTENYCAQYARLRNGKVRWLSPNTGLVAKSIHKLWFHGTLLCPCMYRKSPSELSNRRDLWNFAEVCRYNYRNCQDPLFFSIVLFVVQVVLWI